MIKQIEMYNRSDKDKAKKAERGSIGGWSVPPGGACCPELVYATPTPDLTFTAYISVHPQMVHDVAWHTPELPINADTPYVYSVIAFLARHPRLRLILVDT